MINFDENTHTYTRLGNQYTSVTTLLAKYKLSADYTNIPKVYLDAAASRGSTIHKALEDYVKTGVVSTTDIDPFVSYVNNRNIDLTKAISEQIIYNDQYKIAGTVDIQYEDGNDKVIADFKTTSSIHFDSVSWQLSLYNYIICKGNIIEYYINKLKVIHLKNGRLTIREVPTIEYEEVEKLLNANLNNAPYTYTIDTSKILPDSEGVLLSEIVSELAQYKQIIAELEERKKPLMEKVLTNMKAHNLSSCNINNTHITYTPPTSKKVLDIEKVKALCAVNNIDYNSLLKSSIVNENIKINIKK